MLAIDVDESFWTPISVSSMPSNGPCEGSPYTPTCPVGVIRISSAQLVSTPIAGHCVNGADGSAALPAGAVTATAAHKAQTAVMNRFTLTLPRRNVRAIH